MGIGRVLRLTRRSGKPERHKIEKRPASAGRFFFVLILDCRAVSLCRRSGIDGSPRLSSIRVSLGSYLPLEWMAGRELPTGTSSVLLKYKQFLYC